MTALPATLIPTRTAQQPGLVRVAKFPGLRALTWVDDHLYASRGYQLMRARISEASCAAGLQWVAVANFCPVWWRNLTSASRLSSRAFRDGFHAFAVLPSAGIVAAVPGAIVSLSAGETEFRVTHRITR
jgi:hypothetical protein